MACVPISLSYVQRMSTTKPNEIYLGGVKADQMVATEGKTLSRFYVPNLISAEVFPKICEQPFRKRFEVFAYNTW